MHNHIDRFGLGDAEETVGALPRGLATGAGRAARRLVYPTVDFGADGMSYEHLPPLAAAGVLRVGLCDPGRSTSVAPTTGGPTGGFVYTNSFDLIGATFDIHVELRLGP